MAKKIIKTDCIPREEWLQIRKTGIGGSDAGAIMGLNSWKSTLEVYAEKKGMIPDKETNEAMRLGTDLEQYVADRFMEATGKKVQRTNYMYAHDDYPWMTANIDRVVVGENAALECKTVSPFARYDIENGEIPEQYYCQIMHYMAVMDYDYMYIAFLVYQRGFYWLKVERNDAFILQLIAEEKDFWENHVMANIPPEADGSDSSIETLQQMYPEGNKQTVWIDCDGAVARYKEIADIEKHLKSEKDMIKAKLCEQLGDNSYGEGDRYGCSWTEQKRTTVDTALLKEKHPDIYKECTKETSSRVFRTKELKKKEK